MTDIKLYSKQGRPVLVGTTSVERSEALAAMLKQEGDPRHAPIPLSCTFNSHRQCAPVLHCT